VHENGFGGRLYTTPVYGVRTGMFFRIKKKKN